MEFKLFTVCDLSKTFLDFHFIHSGLSFYSNVVIKIVPILKLHSLFLICGGCSRLDSSICRAISICLQGLAQHPNL